MAYKRRKGKSIVKTKKSYPFKGVEYKSGLERNMAMLLDSNGIVFAYEPKSMQLIESFKFPFKSYERQVNGKGEMINRGEKTVRGITYTPDFVGKDFIIETKGYANETFPLRWKLFKQMLTEKSAEKYPNLVIYKPQKISECEEVINLIKEFRNGKK